MSRGALNKSWPSKNRARGREQKCSPSSFFPCFVCCVAFVFVCFSYTKLKDVAKLDQFVRQSDAGGGGPGGLSFDVLTAINVCRQANYYDHALYLARKHHEHALYLSIQIEDTGNVLDALAYIAALASFKDAERFMKLYGSKLVNAFPKETTRLLTNLCTGWVAIPMLLAPGAGPDAITPALPSSASASSATSLALLYPPSASASSAAPASQRSNPADFIHLFVEHEAELEGFLAHFFEPAHAHILQLLSNQAQAANTGSNSAAGVSKDTKNPQTIVCNTLLELYLRQYAAFETAKNAKIAAEPKGASSASSASSPHHDNPYYNKAYVFIKCSSTTHHADRHMRGVLPHFAHAFLAVCCFVRLSSVVRSL